MFSLHQPNPFPHSPEIEGPDSFWTRWLQPLQTSSVTLWPAELCCGSTNRHETIKEEMRGCQHLEETEKESLEDPRTVLVTWSQGIYRVIYLALFNARRWTSRHAVGAELVSKHSKQAWRQMDVWAFFKVPLCWSSICFTFCLRSPLVSNDLKSICTFSQSKVQKYQSVLSKIPHLLKFAVFAGPSWVLQGATSHFPRSKHHLSSPVALYGWCQQTGMVVAPTENHYLLIKQPHHLLFVFLPLCTQCSKLALLWYSRRNHIKIGLALEVRHWPCTREARMQASCIPCKLYFEANDKLWEQSKPGDCWECCPAHAWHGWSECVPSCQSLQSMAVRRPPHGDTEGPAVKEPWALIIKQLMTQNDQPQRNNRTRKWLLSPIQPCCLYFE